MPQYKEVGTIMNDTQDGPYTKRKYKLLEPEEVEDWYEELKFDIKMSRNEERGRYHRVLEAYLRLCEEHEN